MKTITTRQRSRSSAGGFTLLEVMVALVIISIGMLGIAKMQGLALSNTAASRSRALAAIQASSLAAAMQANRTFWSSATTAPALVSFTTSAGSATITSTGAMQTALTNAAGSQCSGLGQHLSCLCATGGSAPCYATTAPYSLAANDLFDFGWTLATFLPSANASVVCYPIDSPLDCVITINWSENTVALNSQESTQSVNNGSTVPVSFSLYVVP
jgi:type IV pilus assembly protein PilV